MKNHITKLLSQNIKDFMKSNKIIKTKPLLYCSFKSFNDDTFNHKINIVITDKDNVNETFFIKPDFTLTNDIKIAKKQMYWRIRNVGQRELELLIGEWWDANHDKMSFEEITAFNKEVLEMDNPNMNKYFVKLDTPPEDLYYTRRILNLPTK